MRVNPCALCAEQARELGLQVGDTIQGREELGGYWHEARITLLWIGTAHTAWIVSDRSSNEGGTWSPPEEYMDWDLSCCDWQRIKTPPEHAALLPPAPDAKAIRAATLAELRAADAAIGEVALQAEYRAWWSTSYGAPPNVQSVAVAAAWGRHLLGLGLRRLEGGVMDRGDLIHRDTHALERWPRWTVKRVQYTGERCEPGLVLFTKTYLLTGDTFCSYQFPHARWTGADWDPAWWVPTIEEVPHSLLSLVETALAGEAP